MCLSVIGNPKDPHSSFQCLVKYNCLLVTRTPRKLKSNQGAIFLLSLSQGGGRIQKFGNREENSLNFLIWKHFILKINGGKLSEFSSLPCFGNREENSLNFLIWKHFILRINGRKLSEFSSLPCFGNREEN